MVTGDRQGHISLVDRVLHFPRLCFLYVLAAIWVHLPQTVSKLRLSTWRLNYFIFFSTSVGLVKEINIDSKTFQLIFDVHLIF